MNIAAGEVAVPHSWSTRREGKRRRMALIEPWMNGKFLPQKKIVEALETLLVPGDRVVIEDVQKQADFLSRSLAKVNPKRVHGLNAVIWAVARPDHMEIFEEGIAKRLDFSFAGPQSLRVAQMLKNTFEVGSINTYLELSARLFVDLIPNMVLVCADAADREGNLYTGANTEDTPSMVEAAAFRDGIVVVQVNEIVDKLPRVDIPGGWIDVIVEGDRPYAKEPIQTRDPKDIKDWHELPKEKKDEFLGRHMVPAIFGRGAITSSTTIISHAPCMRAPQVLVSVVADLRMLEPVAFWRVCRL